MTRRKLLPPFRTHPHPANLPDLPAGSWTVLSDPAALAQLEFGQASDDDLRTRVQSIPSPWARLLLFKSALEDERHPARRLVENEILDALQFIWASDALGGLTIRSETVRINDVSARAAEVGSQRVEALADALVKLVPGRVDAGARRTAGFDAVTILLAKDQPILASSPFTALFTAEDAATADTGQYFRYASGAAPMTLRERPAGFQRYVAEIILPQLARPAVSEPNVDWQQTQRLLKPWLQREVRESGIKMSTAGDVQAWGALADTLDLIPAYTLGGLQLYKRRRGAMASRWRLRTRAETQAAAPIVVAPSRFDGRFFEGAATVTLPTVDDLARMDRAVLPIDGSVQQWVLPEREWFADRILLLDAPIDTTSNYGYEHVTSSYQGNDDRLKRPHFVLPLTAAFFKHFTPGEVDQMVRLEVRSNGEIEAVLTVFVGTGDVTERVDFRRTYGAGSIHRVSGPSLSVWPSFRDDRWKHYAVFRVDPEPGTMDYLDVVLHGPDGEMGGEAQTRGDRVKVIAAGGPPSLLEFRVRTGGHAAGVDHLGVLLPRWRQPTDTRATERHVGVDFGTSNTVVSLRDGGVATASLFKAKDTLLPLTVLGDPVRDLHDAYFFPDTVKEGPFGTAVVYYRHLPVLALDASRVGTHVNVPFSGHVAEDDHNAVAGDLKWSADKATAFLTESFLRHVMAMVVADAIVHGVAPERLTLSWSHPRSFTEQQVNRLRAVWANVLGEFAGVGLSRVQPRVVDESEAVTRFFVKGDYIATAGAPAAVVDIGGGTSDIGIYGDGRVLLLDSIILGGRDLTGPRDRAAIETQAANPFVRAFSAWALENQLGLYPREAETLRKYLAHGQDHLAFGFLVSTRWFARHGHMFTGHPSFAKFQGVVLYFFGALLYYVGLSMRGIGRQHGIDFGSPHEVVLAGNGSRYTAWLNDLHELPKNSAFLDLFARIVRRGAGRESGPLPSVRTSPAPKHEVALGLGYEAVAAVPAPGESWEPVVGEAVELARPGQSLRWSADDRMSRNVVINTQDVSLLRWKESDLEIERFHRALLDESGGLQAQSQAWPSTLEWMRGVFGRMPQAVLQQRTRGRLEFLLQAHHGFRGSLFILEANCVIDALVDALGDAVSVPGVSGTTRASARDTVGGGR